MNPFQMRHYFNLPAQWDQQVKKQAQNFIIASMCEPIKKQLSLWADIRNFISEPQSASSFLAELLEDNFFKDKLK